MAGTQTGLVSLGAFLDPSDGDGSTEPDALYYDAATHRAYFVLPRTNIFSGSGATDYTPLCPPTPALVIALDTTTDQVIDLNGDAGGQGIALPLVAPGYATDPVSGKLYVVYDGCAETTADGGWSRVQAGIASLDLATGASTPLYAVNTNAFLGGLFATGTSFLVAEDSDLRPWSPTTPATLGAPLADVPNGAVVGSDTTLVGVENLATADGALGPAAVRYEIGTGTTAPIAPIPFTKDWGYVSLAVVR
jgi:hypothetical protein